jgi:hypothetical protein
MKFHPLLAASILALAISPAAALDLSVGGGLSAGPSVSGVSTDLSASAGADLSAGSSSSGSSSVEAEGTVSANGISANSIRGAEKARLSKNLAEVINLIEQADYDEATFAAVADAVGNIYNLGARANAEARAALDAAIAANRDEIADLQSALSASAEMNAWLTASGTDISSVVAVGTTADGSLAVFTL